MITWWQIVGCCALIGGFLFAVVSRRRELPVWYWILIALSACAVAGMIIAFGMDAPLWLMIFAKLVPIFGVPILLVVLGPVLSLPFALRRPNVSPGA